MSLAAILDPRQLGMLFVKDKNEPIYELLRKTSRSFAKVIQQLPDDLANAVCIFYLVLRALDTVEDDPLIDRALKIEMLHSFHELSTKPGYSFHGNSDDEPDAHLLEQYYVVIEQLLLLDPETQKIILDICDKMGHGMAEFVEKPVQTTKEYNLYTHYVAGLVGVGLSRLFVQSGLQSTPLDLELANEMGLFLQKTNILKDYLVDIKCKRLFWPRDVWSLYVQPDQDVDTLSLPENLPRALACLNHLCADNLSLLPSCLEYLSCLDNQQVLRFAAIPQLMAIASMDLFFNNPAMFQKERNKIKRSLAISLMTRASTFESIKQVYFEYCLSIQRQARSSQGTNEHDKSLVPITTSCANAIRWIRDHDAKCGRPMRTEPNYWRYILAFVLLVLFAYARSS